MMKDELRIMIHNRAEPGKQGNPGNFCKWLSRHPKFDQFLTVGGHIFRGSGLDPKRTCLAQAEPFDKLCKWLLPIRAKGSGDGAVRQRPEETSPDATGGNGSRSQGPRPIP